MSRPHHYAYAHRILPGMPLHIARNVLAMTDPTVGLLRTWNLVGEDQPVDERLPATGLGVTVHVVGNNDVMVVTMPTPVKAVEVYFGAIVIPRSPEATRIRYLTMEYAFSPVTKSAYTVLGEWDAEGSHLNFGPGPDPTAEAFLASVRARLEPQRSVVLSGWTTRSFYRIVRGIRSIFPRSS